MEKERNRFEAVLGITVIGGLVTGLAGLLAAVFAFFSYEWGDAGICLAAAALAFGLMANAMLRE